MALQLQDKRLFALLYKCAAFRAAGAGSNQVVLSISYEMDGTSRSISQALLQRIGRANTQRLATEVHNHSCVLPVALLPRAQPPTLFEETVLLPSLVLLGKKTGHFIDGAMQQGIPLAQRRFVAALDQLIVDGRSDLGSANMGAIRHFCDIVGKGGVSNCFDHAACELQVCNRIQAQMCDLVGNVGRLYSIGKLFRI